MKRYAIQFAGIAVIGLFILAAVLLIVPQVQATLPIETNNALLALSAIGTLTLALVTFRSARNNMDILANLKELVDGIDGLVDVNKSLVKAQEERIDQNTELIKAQQERLDEVRRDAERPLKTEVLHGIIWPMRRSLEKNDRAFRHKNIGWNFPERDDEDSVAETELELLLPYRKDMARFRRFAEEYPTLHEKAELYETRLEQLARSAHRVGFALEELEPVIKDSLQYSPNGDIRWLIEPIVNRSSVRGIYAGRFDEDDDQVEGWLEGNLSDRTKITLKKHMRGESPLVRYDQIRGPADEFDERLSDMQNMSEELLELIDAEIEQTTREYKIPDTAYK